MAPKAIEARMTFAIRDLDYNPNGAEVVEIDPPKVLLYPVETALVANLTRRNTTLSPMVDQEVRFMLMNLIGTMRAQCVVWECKANQWSINKWVNACNMLLFGYIYLCCLLSAHDSSVLPFYAVEVPDEDPPDYRTFGNPTEGRPEGLTVPDQHEVMNVFKRMTESLHTIAENLDWDFSVDPLLEWDAALVVVRDHLRLVNRILNRRGIPELPYMIQERPERVRWMYNEDGEVVKATTVVLG